MEKRATTGKVASDFQYAPFLNAKEPQPPRNRRHTLIRASRVVLGAFLALSLLQLLTPNGLSPQDGDYISTRFSSGTTNTGVLPHQSWPHGNGLPYEQLQDILLNTPSAAHAREWSEYYTAGPHLAGKNLSQALWTEGKWQDFGIEDTNIVAYDIYLNYPVDHRLALLKKSTDDNNVGNGDASAEVTFEASLEEDVLDQDRTSGLPDRIPTFHGYSASGNVTAPFVYANFGTYADYGDLVNANVSLEGKIVIVKYGGIFRGLKVKRAQELGAVGVIMYSDPQEDGEITEENGYKAYPDGPARNPSAVQRGSTQFLSKSEFVAIHVLWITRD